MGNQKDSGIEYIPETWDHRRGGQNFLRSLCWWSFLWGSLIYWCRAYLVMKSLCNATLHPRWIFPATINIACRWSKRPAKKNILSIAKVVNFEATPKFLGMEYWRNWCNERIRWTRSKAFPVEVDAMARCSLSINFYASSSSCCCIIVASSPSLTIICSFFSIFFTSTSSSWCSAKASWASPEIAALYSGGIEVAIAAYHSWEDLIYHLFGTYLLQSIFDLFLTVSFKKLSSSCCNNAARIASFLVAGQQLLIYRAVPLTS